MIKYFSMFSGIGGFELGLQQSDHEFECVGYSEIDKHAIQTYERHFNHEPFGSATEIDPASIPRFELLVGGFPCQAFSIAGKRGGFNDTRGTLFFDIARILQYHRPRNFILENVKGLLSHDGGRTFRTIIATLTELGYGVEWQVLNSKNFGVPQNRERVYIIGHSLAAGSSARAVLPVTGSSNPNSTVGKSAETAVARTFTAGGNSGGNHSGMTIIKTVFPVIEGNTLKPRELTTGLSQAHRIYDTECSVTLSALGGGMGAKSGLYFDRREKFHNSIRRLTPVETERLQGFPDHWTFGVSDTQRAKQCGNAVTVNVVEYLANKLFR